MGNEELLPKPELDLPLPEKEILEHATPASKGDAFRSYFSRLPLILLIPLVLLILLVLVGGAFVLSKNNSNKQIACTQEAKVCPDGSSVSRTGPKCEFAKCPEVSAAPSAKSSVDTSNWKTYAIPGQYEFKYPLNDYSVKTDISSGTNIEYEWPGKTNVEPNDSYLERKTGDNSSFSIYAVDNKDKLTLNDGAKLLGYTKSTLPSGVTQKQITVGGLKGVRFDNIPNQGYPESDIFIISNGNKISNNGLIYTIVLSDHGQNDLSANSTAEKILSTLKFIQ